MNKGLLILNIFLAVAIAVLFFLYFRNMDSTGTGGNKKRSADSTTTSVFRIAYFDMDSIEANFSLFKDMQKEVSKKEDSMQTVLNSARMALQSKYKKYQEQGATMSETQVKIASDELKQMDMDIKNSEANLNQSFQNFYMNKQQEVITQIKKYCTEFNKDGKYSYIIANEPGLVYYKDTACNITTELLKGLNALYDKQKKN